MDCLVLEQKKIKMDIHFNDLNFLNVEQLFFSILIRFKKLKSMKFQKHFNDL